MGYRSRTSAEAIEHAKLVDRAILMRVAGSSYQVIAEALGVTSSTAHRWVTKFIDTKPQESADQLRLLAMDRLDMIARVHAATIGNPASARVMIAATELACRLGGLLRDPTVTAVVGYDVRVFDAENPPVLPRVDPGRFAIDVDSAIVSPPTMVDPPPG